jgi:hypothetical protein
MLHEPRRPHALPHLFVRVGQEDDVPLQLHAGALQDQHGHQLDHAFALHIESAASPDVAILDGAAERRHAPELGGREHHVHVVEQDQRASAPIARQPRVEIRLAGTRLEDADFDPLAPQHLLEPARRGYLVAGWIRGVDLQILRQQLGRLAAQRLPIRLGSRLGE